MQNNSFNEELDSEQTVFSKKELQVELICTNGKVINKFSFSQGFTVGRTNDNDIVILEGDVSRYHLKITRTGGQWWVHNLNSANGVYIHGQMIEDKCKLEPPVSVALGLIGIALNIKTSDQFIRKKETVTDDSATIFTDKKQKINQQPQRNLSEAEIKERLLKKEEAEDSGDYTRMVRRIIRQDQSHRSKSYKKVIWALASLFVLASAVVAYQQIALSNANTLALNMFYDIKTMEVNLSQTEIRLEKNTEALKFALQSIDTTNMEATQQQKIEAERQKMKAELEKVAAEREKLKKERKNLTKMKAKYQLYVKKAKSLRFSFSKASSYEEKLIIRVAKNFGESELELPKGFINEVQKYIGYWQSTKRMPNAMNTLVKMGYTPIIIGALKKEGLPLDFLYLPLQESNFNYKIVGPKTHWGIAKGAWQFIPATARNFGLKPGPRENTREYDMQDDRFDFNKASKAGAKYLKSIYSTESQASGLLVIAGYNYGEPRVNKNIKKMPNNPRDRNFWKYIQKYKLPKQTYDYVFYIFAAAVIGQDPKYFGFNFKPPFLQAENIQ